MGLIDTEFFESCSYEGKGTHVIVCNECSAHLCLSNLVLSDQFWGSSGDAYLVDKLINISCEDQDFETSMRTGVYVINKIKCSQCSTRLGWHYKKSYNYSEYYKEGKYVIEDKYICKIPNHSSTAVLTQHAKLSRRRRSSASMNSTSGDDVSLVSAHRPKLDADDFDFSTNSAAKIEPRRSSVLNFREGISHFLSRNRLSGIDKDNFDERDEDSTAYLSS